MHLVLTDADNNSFIEKIKSQITSYESKKFCTFNNNEDINIISLSAYIEKNSYELREIYLEFIDNLANQRLGEKKVIDFLRIHNRYSYWFSSSLFEKSIYKQNYTDAIRLIAIDQLLVKYDINELTIYIKSKTLKQSIIELCYKRNIKIFNKKSRLYFYDYRNTYIFFILKSLYTFFKISLRYYKHKELDFNKKGILFIGPLSYLNTDIVKNKLTFNSNLWSGISDLLEKNSIQANFLHIYSPHPEISSIKDASNIIDALNRTNVSNHFLLDSNLSLIKKIKIFFYWIKTALKFFFFRNKKEIFNLKSSKVNLFYILKDNYLDSFAGPGLIYNLFFYEYLEKIQGLYQNQHKFFYLCENHGWENIFCYIAKNNSKKNIYAVPHSTIRFWDLRHFSSVQNKKSYIDIKDNYYLANSKFVKDEFIKNNYDKNKIIECEALRYQERIENKAISKNGLLVLLDYSSEYTRNMMNFLQKFENKYPGKAHFIFKSHINSPINLEDYDFKYSNIYNGDINSALSEYDI